MTVFFTEIRLLYFNRTKKGGGGQVSNTAEVISEPVLMEQYVVQADYKKLGRGQISLVAGDVVEVIEKSDNGK